MRTRFLLPFFTFFVLVLNAQDFYVVDSLYCYAHSPVEVPTERQYNLEFTNDGAVIASRSEQFLTWLGQWRFLKFQTNVYDVQNNLIEQTEQRWDTLAMTWINAERTQNTPNQNGNFTQVLNQEWSGSNWKNVDRINTVFNANGFAETLTRELWDDGSAIWKKNFRILYARNAGNQLIQTKFQLWSQTAGDYYDVSRTTYSYDSQNPALETENVTDVFNTQTAQWEKSSRSVKGYDGGGNLIEETTQLWNLTNNDWLNQNRILQNFSPTGQVTLRTELLWNGTQWVNFFKTNNVYDLNGNLTRFEVSQWQINEWKLLNSCDFYVRFHHEILSANEVVPFFCQVPNPLWPGIALHCENLPTGQTLRLSIFDLTGRLVHAENIENQHFIKINKSLPHGMFVLTITGENGLFFTQKIVIPR